MKRKITILDPHEAQKIAAGEVVERPANIAKELLENSIDAGATKISLHLKHGGQESIRIVDNGCGMNSEDAKLCFERHATSKIKNVNQLHNINTFGFRGEALASISAISIVTLQTKEHDADLGIKLMRKNTQYVDKQQVACPSGTDITIDDIFFNVPARKKFLKKKETEQRHITQLFHAFCLQNLSIHFSLYIDDKHVLNCPPVKTLKERMYQLWKDPLRSNVITLEKTEKNNITISGAISNHHYFRYDRNVLYFFVNNRWVKNLPLARALTKGYLNVLPQGRFPAACINIAIDPEEVDINIHPRKEEVKFLHPRRVEILLTQAVKNTLENHLSQQLKKEIKIAPAQKTFYSPTFPAPTEAYADERKPFINPIDMPFPHQASSTEKQTVPFEQPSPLTTSTWQQTHEHIEKIVETQNEIVQKETHTIIGQMSNTYILLQHKDGLYIVDQHAAHERILYERFKKHFGNAETISLLFPQIITLSEQALKSLEPHLPLIKQHGIIVEPFGTNQLRVQATPIQAKNIHVEALIKEVLSWIEEFQQLEQETFFKKINERMHAQMACKAAVKAGDKLTLEQMQTLLEDLENVPNRFSCPHGRPTGWLLSTHDIEKKFKRKV